MSMEQDPLPQREVVLANPEPRTAGRDHAQHRMVVLLKRWLATLRRDQAALITTFVGLYAEKLLRFAARTVGAQDAPDVAQAAFETLARWLQGRPVPEAMRLLASSEELWKLMVTFTARRAVDHLRSKKKRDDPLIRDDRAVERAVDIASTARSEAVAEIARIARVYEAMPPEQRVAHLLCRYYGFTDAEVEATLNINRSTARGLVYRASIELAHAMERKP